MKIYNTLTRKKEDFVPLHDGQVNMYACGITVSGDAHIGHAYQALIYDIIRKYFEKIGYKVREARQVDRVPYMLIIGKNEIENRVVSVRNRETDQTETMPFDDFLAKITDQIKNRV